MFIKITAPDGEYKREGHLLTDCVEENRDLYLNLNSVCSIHVVKNRIYFDRLRLTFENENAAQNAITVLTEAMRNNETLTEISQGVITVKALSGCNVNMCNGASTETDDGPIKPEPTEVTTE